MACQPGPPVEKVPPMRNKGLMAGLIVGTTMVNNPFNKALFVMGVPYMGAPVDWPKKLRLGRHYTTNLAKFRIRPYRPRLPR